MLTLYFKISLLEFTELCDKNLLLHYFDNYV